MTEQDRLSEHRPFRIRRAGHIVIRCADAERTAAFFRDVVGFKPFGKTPRGMHFLTADFTENHHMLLVRPAREGAPAPDPERRLGFARVSYEMTAPGALQALRARLTAHGTAFAEGATPDSVVFHDPDGNLFEFYCRPGTACTETQTDAMEPAS